MINDDLAGKASSYGVIRECLFHCVLDSANGKTAVIVVAGSEAYYHKLLISNLILISCVVHRCVSSVVILFVFFLHLGLFGLGFGGFLCSLSGCLLCCGCLGHLCFSRTACHHRSRKRGHCK